MAFDFLLGLFNGPGDHVGRNRFVFVHAQLIHEAGNVFRTEDAHQVIFEGQEELRRPRVALTGSTTAELIVDTAAFVAFRTDDHQAAQVSNTFAELDVRAAAGHVGRNGDHVALTGVLDDFRFFFMVFGVQHVVNDVFFIEELT